MLAILGLSFDFGGKMIRWRRKMACKQLEPQPRNMIGIGFVVSDSVMSAAHEGGLILFCLKRGLLFRTNSAGARIWRGLAEGRGGDELATELCQEFGITGEKATEDTARFFQSLLNHRLLLPRGGRND